MPFCPSFLDMSWKRLLNKNQIIPQKEPASCLENNFTYLYCQTKWKIKYFRAHLIVYSSVPSSVIRNNLFGIVILWATDFFPLWKKVSGVQILLAIKLFNRRTVIGPLNFNLSSFQLWRKNTSIVYSYTNSEEKR